MWTDVILVHLRKAPPPIVVTELGMAINVNLLQSQNANEPIVVTDELDMKVTEVIFVQLSKAYAPIVVTDSGIVTEVKLVQKLKVA